MRECIDLCRQLESACLRTVDHCLRKGGPHAEPGHVNLLLACAEICGAGARFMALRSEFHVQACELCADVCEAAADDCERNGVDPILQRFAEACRRCAESCRELAGRPARRRRAAPALLTLPAPRRAASLRKLRTA